ncbi:Syntaxin-8 [Trachymyrmex cornetzi]|uniref:Syntaxin-8 n=1 Tax=Trachymyrmex cornetzi TaxID=471704 RepID=A0A195DIM6_9HYME|nr:Syntaxin-8 [Trachymyrmex cornetzi]
MADDDILVRLDEIEKLQTELRHLVPRVTSNSSRHLQNVSRDSSASNRFPSLFTFPVISNFTSTPKNERVQKSAARLNLNSKSSSSNRHSTINLKNTEGSQSRTRETNVFKNLLRSSNNVTSSHVRNSSVSTSVANSTMPIRSSIANRMVRDPQEAIKKRLKSETTARDKTQRATSERSNVQLSRNENVNSMRSLQISDIQIHESKAIESWDTHLKNRYCKRNCTLIERFMQQLNYCFINNKRVTVPYHHLGNRTPRRVQILHSPTIKETEILRLHESEAKMLTEYDACEKLFREIMEQLTMRDGEPKTSKIYASLSANIRLRMKQYTREVQQLKSKVEEVSKLKTITFEEAERRTRQVEQLQSKDIQLQKLYEPRTNDYMSSRTSLLRAGSSAFADGGTTSWAADDDDDKPLNVQVSVNDLMSHQERVLIEQDKGLEELCKVIARQKEIGQTISNEVDHQNEIIDDLADHMDRTDESLINKTQQVRNINSKDRTCGYWIVILILFIAIIIVSFV